MPSPVMICGHKVHAECFVKLANKFKTSVLGGRRHCRVCSLTGTDDSDDSDDGDGGGGGNERLSRKKCLEEMRHAHRHMFHDTDLDEVMKRELTDNEMRCLLGALDERDVIPSVVKRIRVLIKDLVDVDDDEREAKSDPAEYETRMAEREKNRRRLLSLRGKELLDEMASRGRSFAQLLEENYVHAAHLHRAGIDTVESLQHLGYDLTVHTARRFHRKFPVYFLVEHFQLRYERHLSWLPNQTLQDMMLTKQEMRLLRITATNLIEERKVDASFVLKLSIRPSDLSAYLGMTEAHFLSLEPALTRENFKNNALWDDDRDVHDFSKNLYAAVKERERAKRSKK
jgi:hypothetical protein